MSAVLDDLDSRPGSATSLLRTVVGLYLRRVGGWMSVAQLIELMGVLDISAAATRNAVARLKKKGVVASRSVDGVAGYELGTGGAQMLARGDRRIYSPRTMGADDAWCLISFSVPEQDRALRHQLRRRLQWIGAGNISSALWICADFLAGEVEQIVDEVGARQHVTLFRTEAPRVAGELRDAVARWWDLDALAALHRGFIAAVAPWVEHDGGPAGGGGPGTSATSGLSFSRFVLGIDAWRVIPYLDPGLPLALLPESWPGAESTRVFDRLTDLHGDPAWEFVRQTIAVGRR